MTMHVELNPKVEAGLLSKAASRGLSLEAFVAKVLEDVSGRGLQVEDSGSPAESMRRAVTAQPASAGEYVELEPEEWVRKFQAWSQRHAHDDLPILSDEAISRESIYEDRGL